MLALEASALVARQWAAIGGTGFFAADGDCHASLLTELLHSHYFTESFVSTVSALDVGFKTCLWYAGDVAGGRVQLIRLTRLKAVRQRKLLTQQELAAKAGVSRPTVVRIEAGLEAPFPTTIRKLADALGVDPELLMEPEA